MPKENTLLIGQLLQIRDNIIAKRHAIPGSLQNEWNRLRERTAEFDIRHAFTAARKGTTFTKPTPTSDSASELSSLVTAMRQFNAKISL